MSVRGRADHARIEREPRVKKGRKVCKGGTPETPTECISGIKARIYDGNDLRLGTRLKRLGVALGDPTGTD